MRKIKVRFSINYPILRNHRSTLNIRVYAENLKVPEYEECTLVVTFNKYSKNLCSDFVYLTKQFRFYR